MKRLAELQSETNPEGVEEQDQDEDEDEDEEQEPPKQ